MWQHDLTGQKYIWFLGQAPSENAEIPTLWMGPIEGSTADPSWVIVGAGDFGNGYSGDGVSLDLVLQNYQTGESAIWWMNQKRIAWGDFIRDGTKEGVPIIAVEDEDWRICSVARFDISGNSSGNSDLFLRYTPIAMNVVWFMNGHYFQTQNEATRLKDPAWRFGHQTLKDRIFRENYWGMPKYQIQSGYNVGPVENRGTVVLVVDETVRSGITTSVQFTLRWDPAILGFQQAGTGDLPDVTEKNFGVSPQPGGILAFSWNAPLPPGASLPDGASIFSLQFELLPFSRFDDMKKAAIIVLLTVSISAFGDPFRNLGFEEANTNSTKFFESITADGLRTVVWGFGPTQDLLPGWQIFRGLEFIGSLGNREWTRIHANER